MAILSIATNAKYCPYALKILESFNKNKHNCIVPSQGSRYEYAKHCMTCWAYLQVCTNPGLTIDGQTPCYDYKLCTTAVEELDRHSIIIETDEEYTESKYCQYCSHKLLRDTVPATPVVDLILSQTRRKADRPTSPSPATYQRSGTRKRMKDDSYLPSRSASTVNS